MTTEAGVQGFQPIVTEGNGNPEVLKYGKLWGMEKYRETAPGEMCVPMFLERANPPKGAHIIDYGCGTGRPAHMLALMGYKVTMIDFARNCLDPQVREYMAEHPDQLSFRKHDLEQPLPIAAEYGFCTDVMEHFPPETVGKALDNILLSAQHVFFSIALGPDNHGPKLIGERLHLSVHDYWWWLSEFGKRKVKITYSEEAGTRCYLVVTAWTDSRTIVDSGRLNNEVSVVLDQVRQNCDAGWQQVEPHRPNDFEVMILGGGPSLNQFESDIKRKRADGCKLVTLNNAYNWALEHGLTPSATVMVDSREFNKRFVRPVVDECKYLMASQCHPAALADLPRERTWLWHSMNEDVKQIAEHYYGTWWPIPGGTTVLLRAIPLLRMLGYQKFHLYGCDSCLMDGAHHAYSQPENDSKYALPVTVTGGRVFWCHPWMVAQAHEFQELIKVVGEEVELSVYGDGLLAHMLNKASELLTEKEE